jgi:diguanylate cyclase (GGDEF)-like protein/PAS domain S-box-containing protein
MHAPMTREMLPEVERRRRQQRAVAELGQAALSRIDPEILLRQTCALVETVLGIARCRIVSDPPAGAGAGLVAPIGRGASAFGLLAAFDDRDRTFAADEVEFLEAVAHLTAAMLERARIDRELALSGQRFRSLVENSSDGIFLVDANGIIEYASPSSIRLLGAADSELAGIPLVSLLHPDDVVKASRNHSRLTTAPAATVQDELRVRHANSEWRDIEIVARNLLDDPAVGAIVVNYRDITDRRLAEQQLQHLAYHDTLTNLPNRFLFGDRLRHAIDQARRRHRGLAVIYLDLDRFKLVNDTLGHTAGDQLLQAVARRLCEIVRLDDTVARLGGDEFALLLLDIDRPEDAGRVGGKILDALRAPLNAGEHQLYATGSIGISMYPNDAEDAASLLRNADTALYRAKELGRNNVQLFAASMNERYRSRLEIEQRLRRAVDHDELMLHYQPIVDVRSGTVRAVEALVRWRQEDGRIAPPADFISVAEETGLILLLGEWVIARACADLAAWRAAGLTDLRVALNLSAQQIQQRSFARFLGDTIVHAGLPPDAVEIEITESTAMQNLQWSLSVLEQLHSFGVRVTVDDFGTGQSSLACLKRFPLDTLKIDREFLCDMKEPSDTAILGAIVALGRSLGLYVVAEGVETPEEVELLRHYGCDGLQGYFLGRPRAPEEVPEMVRSFRWPARRGVMNAAGISRAAASADRG